MKAPERPVGEVRRLATLRALGLLDTPPDARFDAITRSAAALFETPIALITLVDEHRQWFKSRQGLADAETPRDVSFCGHAILGGELLVVEDALLDDRFSDNPLVVNAPHVRFYAGAPLSAPNGDRIGTLCLMDRRPRSLSTEQRVLLGTMGAWAEGEIGMQAERCAIGGFIDLLLQHVSEPVVLASGSKRIRFANAAALRLLRYRSEEIYGKAITELITPANRARFESELGALERSGESFRSLEYTTTVRCGDGRELSLSLAFLNYDVAGRDVTALVFRPP